MFWKKKQVTTSPVVEGTAGGTGVKSSETNAGAEVPKAAKLPGPRSIPGLVEKYLVANYKIDPDLTSVLRVAVRKRPDSEKAYDCRIFDPEEAEASEIQVKNYTSLDGHPDLILYDGWFDEESKQVELQEKKKGAFDAPLFTEAEILQKIEALTEPGSSVFFYQNAGPAAGGPLGRGAAIIELNPHDAEKKGKKYLVYTANVVGMEPLPKRNMLFGSDKPKEIAKWIKQSHNKRTY